MQGVALALVVLVTVHNLPTIRPSYTFIPWIDGWVQGTCFVLGAVVCLLRAARRDEDAWLWGWVGVALAARALGFVSFFSYVRFQSPIPYPSLADAFWLATPVLMMVGLVLLVRSRFRATSTALLLDVAFPDQLAMLIESEGLPGSALELELTEDLFMADPDRARGVIRDLRRLGVQLMVDDYGAGYSSLGYLRDLHEIAGLKIDRSFVTHLVDDDRAAAIVQSTLTLARSLDLRVIAEGVETPAARDRLAELGCELAQGYLFARPAPATTIRFGGIGEARAERR